MKLKSNGPPIHENDHPSVFVVVGGGGPNDVHVCKVFICAGCEFKGILCSRES